MRLERRVCFVSGTRAEFGLAVSTLNAIAQTPGLRLQIILTGMHLDRSRGRSADAIRRQGWVIDRIVPWKAEKASPAATASATGRAMAALTAAFAELQPDVVLVVGDRVEAFAAAAAAHIAGIIVAHLHGGDRALGQVDDSLRHAITKLAHLHFPATQESANRISRLGEDRFRIFRAGAPGLDQIRELAAKPAEIQAKFPTLLPGKYALLVLHPGSPFPAAERRAARMVLTATQKVCGSVAVVYPNNDPGSGGIVSEWDRQSARKSGVVFCRDLPRDLFLGLLRDTGVLVGNSSAGMIEAASFGTPVLDVGPRQTGRQHSGNLQHVELFEREIAAALRRIWSHGHPGRWRGTNVYGRGGAGPLIAETLRRADLKRLVGKLIAY